MSKLFFVLFTIQGIVSIAQSVQPSDLTNLSLWLRAENGVTHSANAVSNWLDFSGANNNCSQNSTANRPLLVNNVDQLAGKSVIRFDGTNDFLNGTTISNINNSSFTIFVIANGESQSSSIASLFSINTAATGFYFTRRPSLNRFSVFNSNTSINSNGSFPSTGYNYRLVTGIKSLGSSFSLKVNGSQDFNSTLTGLTSSFTNAIYQIGAGNSSNFFRGDIAEVIIYTRELTSVEITQIENYLMNKYAPPVNLGVDVNDTYGFEDLTLSTSGFFSSYLWQTPSGNFNTPTITVNNPGQYQLTAIDIFGRVSTDTIVVSRPYYDIIQLSNQVICHNENTLITAPMPVGDYQFVQWSDGVTTQTRTINQTVSLSYTIKDNSNFTRTSNVATYFFDNSLQNIRLGNDTTLCFGNTIGLVVTSPSINSYLWSTASTGSTATVTTTGEYSVTVTNANNCQKRDTIFVTIAGESPTVQALIANSVCVGSELDYNHISSVNGGTIANVLWNFGDNSSSTSDAGTKVYTQVGTYNGTLLVTTDGGCQTQVPFQVNVRNKPLVNFSVPIFCSGQPVTITNISSLQSGGGSFQNYNWLVDGQSVANSQNLLFTFPNNGDYLLKLIVTDVNGCVDSTSQLVSADNNFPIPQAPVLNSPLPNITLAVGQAHTFQWSNVPNATAYIFEVSTQANFTSLHFQTSTTSTSFSYTPSITGNLFWRVRTVNLCQLGGTSEVRAYTTIDLGTGISMWLRADAGVTTVSNAVSQWIDQSGMGLNVSQATTGNRPTLVNNVASLNNRPAISFNGTSNFLTSSINSGLANSSLTVFVIGSGGNQSTSNAVYYSVGPVSSGFWLTRRASSSRIGAYNNNQLVQGTITNLPTNGYDFRLFGLRKSLGNALQIKVNGINEIVSTNTTAIGSFTDANIQIGAGNSGSFLNGQIAEVLVYNRDLSDLELSQVEKYLMDKYAPPVNLGADINNSYGFCDIILAPVTGFYTNYLWSTNATTSSISINNPGTYWVTATDIFGRVSHDTIIINRPPYNSIGLNNQLVCYNDLPTVTAAMPSGDYTFVQWSDGNPNQTRQYTQGGTLSYTVRDNQNCTLTSNTATITFDNSLQTVRLGNDTTLCVGNSIGLVVTSPSINSYLWSTASTGSTATVTTTGEYSVTVTNANNCQKRDTIFVTIAGESPTVQALIANSVCVGSELDYNHISSVNGGTIANVLWNFGDNSSSTSDAGTKVYTQVGTYNGTLLVTTDGGCQTQVPFQVNVRNKPLVNFSVPIFCSGQPVTITNISSLQSGGGSFQNYNWLVDGQSVANSQNLLFTFPNNGDYLLKLIVTDVNGCVDSTSQLVSADNNFPIPQAPVLNSPLPNITLAVGQAHTFQWSNVPNATAYIFEVSTQANFTSLHFQTSTTSTSFSYTPSITGNLFWRVRTVNLCQLGGTSEVRAYTTIDLGTGISMWLRADAGVTTVSNAVSQWIDQSGMGLNVSQATTGNRPTLVNNVASLNNRPAISFNGTSNFLTSSINSGLANSSLTVFVIGSGGNQSTSNAVYYSVGPVSSGFWLTRRASSSRIGAYNNNQLVQGTITNLPTNGYDFRLFGLRKSLGNALQIKVNGINEIVSTNTTAIGSFTDANIQIGAGNSGSFLNGQIAEVLVYNRDLSDLELSQVEKYLMDKYAPPVNLGADINNSYGFCDIILAPVTGFYTNYLWSTNATTSSISINNPGTYWVTATDIFGRVSRDTIIVNRPHYSQIALNDRLVCFNEPQLYSANVPANYQFITWNDGVETPSRIVAEPLSLTYTVMDTNSCLRTSNVGIISIDSTLKYISLDLDTSLCVGNTISLLQSAPEITSYLWNTNSTISTATVNATGNYWVEVGNANNCNNRDTIFVQILGVAPTVSLNIPNQACQFDSVLLAQTSSVNGSGMVNAFEWKINGNIVSTQNNFINVFSNPNNYEISFKASTDEGCQTVVNQNLTVHPKPIATFQIANQCPYQVMSFSPQNNVAVALSNYEWNFNNIGNSSQSSPNFTFGNAGIYPVTLRVEDINGCKDTVIQQVEVFPAPNSQFNFENGCQRDGVQFTNSTTIPEPYIVLNQNWQFGDGTQSTNISPLKTYSGFGTYEVRLVNIANNGCVDTLIKSITINPKPVLSWTVSPSCKGLLTSYQSSSTVPLGEIVATDWLVNLQFPQSGLEGAYRFVTTGTQFLTLSCETNEGCVEDTLIKIVTNPELRANFSVFPNEVVAGKEVRFNNLSVGANAVRFEFGDGNIQQFTNAPSFVNHIFADTLIEEEVTTWMYVNNSFGCTDSISKTFIINRPDLDLELSNMFIQEINGFFKVGVEMRNRGKINISQVELIQSKSNGSKLKELYNGLIQPGQSVVYLFNADMGAFYSDQDNQTDYVCVDAQIKLPLDNEPVLSNNTICQALEEGLILTPIFPNPTEDILNWSVFNSNETSIMKVDLYSTDGSLIKTNEYVLNSNNFETHQLDVSELSSGLYLLRMELNGVVKLERFIKK